MSNTTLYAMGHNGGPPFDPAVLDAFRPRLNDFAASMGHWLDLGVIESEEDASRLNDFLTGARKLFKEIDEARVAAKKPHDDNSKAVQAAFTPLLDLLTKTAEKGKPLLTAWAQKQQAILRAQQERDQAEARRKAEEAKLAALQAAQRNDVVGEVHAEALAKEAETARKAAEKPVNAKVASATGGGRTMAMRSIANVKLTNINLLFMQFRDAPEVAEVLLTLARRKVRAASWVKGETLPGGDVYYVETMA